jgi:hypothetical protein
LIAVAQGEQPPIPRFLLERSKGSSKDSDLSCCLLFLLAVSDRPLRIQVAANDSDQASEIRLVIKQILKLPSDLNSVLAAVLEVQAEKIINRSTGSMAQILTRDSAGGHGSRPDVLIINELTHIQDEGYAQTCMDNADKMGASGLVVIAQNAGFTATWQERWKAIALSSSRWWCQIYARPAPWISPADLEESERRNPRSRYRRLWWGEWSSGDGDAIDANAILAAIVLPGPHLLPQIGHQYFIGVDLSLRRDASAVVLLSRHVGHFAEQPAAEKPARSRIAEILADLRGEHCELPEADGESTWIPGDGCLHLAGVEVFTPTAGGEIDLTAVERAVALLHRVFNAVVLCDEYQAALLAQRLRAASVPAQTVPPTGPNLREQAGIILDAFTAKPPTIKLYRHEGAIADIGRWRLVEKSYGLRLVSPQGVEGESTRHGDIASALALAALASQRFANHAAFSTVQGELICWP